MKMEIPYLDKVWNDAIELSAKAADAQAYTYRAWGNESDDPSWKWADLFEAHATELRKLKK